MMDGFTHGALMTIGLIVRMHDQPTIAADILKEMGMLNADCSTLDEFDKANLRKLRGELGGAVRLRGLGKPPN